MEQRLVGFTCRNCGPCGYQVEDQKELKMAGENNKNAIWALLLSLLALITTFQQNYHNYQLVVTPNERVGFYCRDYSLNDPPPFLSGLCHVQVRIFFLAKTVTWC